MPSLMQAVLEDIVDSRSHLTEEEFLASFDLDGSEIAAVEGGWERMSGYDPHRPAHPDIHETEFKLGGPSVYEVNGFMIVRGTKKDQPVWFIYEPVGIGVH